LPSTIIIFCPELAKATKDMQNPFFAHNSMGTNAIDTQPDRFKRVYLQNSSYIKQRFSTQTSIYNDPEPSNRLRLIAYRTQQELARKILRSTTGSRSTRRNKLHEFNQMGRLRAGLPQQPRPPYRGSDDDGSDDESDGDDGSNEDDGKYYIPNNGDLMDTRASWNIPGGNGNLFSKELQAKILESAQIPPQLHSARQLKAYRGQVRVSGFPGGGKNEQQVESNMASWGGMADTLIASHDEFKVQNADLRHLARDQRAQLLHKMRQHSQVVTDIVKEVESRETKINQLTINYKRNVSEMKQQKDNLTDRYQKLQLENKGISDQWNVLQDEQKNSQQDMNIGKIQLDQYMQTVQSLRIDMTKERADAKQLLNEIKQQAKYSIEQQQHEHNKNVHEIERKMQLSNDADNVVLTQQFLDSQNSSIKLTQQFLDSQNISIKSEQVLRSRISQLEDTERKHKAKVQQQFNQFETEKKQTQNIFDQQIEELKNDNKKEAQMFEQSLTQLAQGDYKKAVDQLALRESVKMADVENHIKILGQEHETNLLGLKESHQLVINELRGSHQLVINDLRERNNNGIQAELKRATGQLAMTESRELTTHALIERMSKEIKMLTYKRAEPVADDEKNLTNKYKNLLGQQNVKLQQQSAELQIIEGKLQNSMNQKEHNDADMHDVERTITQLDNAKMKWSTKRVNNVDENKPAKRRNKTSLKEVTSYTPENRTDVERTITQLDNAKMKWSTKRVNNDDENKNPKRNKKSAKEVIIYNAPENKVIIYNAPENRTDDNVSMTNMKRLSNFDENKTTKRTKTNGTEFVTLTETDDINNRIASARARGVKYFETHPIPEELRTFLDDPNVRQFVIGSVGGRQVKKGAGNMINEWNELVQQLDTDELARFIAGVDPDLKITNRAIQQKKNGVTSVGELSNAFQNALFGKQLQNKPNEQKRINAIESRNTDENTTNNTDENTTNRRRRDNQSESEVLDERVTKKTKKTSTDQYYTRSAHRSQSLFPLY
jgi:hypothetical protein